MINKTRGKAGGDAVLAKFGRDHFVKLGQAGGRAMHKKFYLLPVARNDFLIINRTTLEVNSKTLNGRKIDPKKARSKLFNIA